MIAMPFGSGQFIRWALVRANPWQRYALAILMFLAGIALVVEGHAGGALLAVAGVGLLGRMLRHRARRRIDPRTSSDTDNV